MEKLSIFLQQIKKILDRREGMKNKKKCQAVQTFPEVGVAKQTRGEILDRGHAEPEVSIYHSEKKKEKEIAG